MKKIAYCYSVGIVGLLTTEFGVIGILPQLASYYHLNIAKAGWLLSRNQSGATVVPVPGPLLVAGALSAAITLPVPTTLVVAPWRLLYALLLSA
jgi:predicted MFS family arabinose efflux permease